MKHSEWIEGLHLTLLFRADSLRAKGMSNYMKQNFDFYGISSTERRNIMSEYREEIPLPKIVTGKDLVDFMVLSWGNFPRELQYCALDIGRKYVKLLEMDDIKGIEYLITHKSWWDSVDSLAPYFAASILSKDKAIAMKKSEEWIASGNLWLQRSAVIYQLKQKSKTDTEILEHNIMALIDHKDFFIRKAIGWALREYAKTNPDFTLKFVENHKDLLSNLSIREALKHFS
jgi:3-methyladenine DNA glycosylase AlkD